jgi:hypothetical protein
LSFRVEGNSVDVCQSMKAALAEYVPQCAGDFGIDRLPA